MNLDKIIRTLDLSKSDARDKTIQGLIEYILYCVNEQVDAKELSEFIKVEFNLELFSSEIAENLLALIDLGSVKNNSGNKYSLTDERSFQIRKLEIENNNERQKRFEQFCISIKKIAKGPVSSENIDLLWQNFSEYIYECYLEHGKSALSAFNVKKNSDENGLDVSSILNKYLARLNDHNLSKIFKKYVENFPQEISVESLDYLMELANKSEAFFALGLSKEEYEQIYKNILFDWIVLVDTNFLYSILDLHSHPDTEAAKAVLELGMQLNIKFYYLNITLKELQNQSKDFESTIPKNLNASQISALVKSEQLDDFAMRYFEKKLQDMVNTPHPKDVAWHAQTILKQKGVNIYGSSLDHLASLGDYLLDQESKYSDYLKMLDEQRAERGLPIKGIKDSKQIEHDIFLREALVSLRDAKIYSINDMKYLGLTLDRRLIKYDQYLTMKKRDGSNIPIFFSPTALLKKILKFLPVKSDDYRRAFIKTISTPALNDNVYTSKVTIRSVKYFHYMGISDEQMILNSIKDEMFLAKFQELEGDQELLKEFVESKIQNDFKELSRHLQEVEDLVEKKNHLISDVNQQTLITVEENKKLETTVSLLKEQVKVYDHTIHKLNNQHNKNLLSGHQLTLDDEQTKFKDESKIAELESQNIKLSKEVTGAQNKLKVVGWRLRSLWLLIPVAFIAFNIVMVFCWQKEPWNYVTKLIDWYEHLVGARKDVAKWMTTFLLSLVLFWPVREIKKRLFSKSARKCKLNCVSF